MLINVETGVLFPLNCIYVSYTFQESVFSSSFAGVESVSTTGFVMRLYLA